MGFGWDTCSGPTNVRGGRTSDWTKDAEVQMARSESPASPCKAWAAGTAQNSNHHDRWGADNGMRSGLGDTYVAPVGNCDYYYSHGCTGGRKAESRQP